MKKEFFTPKDKNGKEMQPVEIIAKFSQLGCSTVFDFVVHCENSGLDVIVSEKETGAKFCRIAGFYGSTLDSRYYTKKEILEKAKTEVALMFIKYGAKKIESVIFQAIEKQKSQG